MSTYDDRKCEQISHLLQMKLKFIQKQKYSMHLIPTDFKISPSILMCVNEVIVNLPADRHKKNL